VTVGAEAVLPAVVCRQDVVEDGEETASTHRTQRLPAPTRMSLFQALLRPLGPVLHTES
jgi:hypothetical protein